MSDRVHGLHARLLLQRTRRFDTSIAPSPYTPSLRNAQIDGEDGLLPLQNSRLYLRVGVLDYCFDKTCNTRAKGPPPRPRGTGPMVGVCRRLGIRAIPRSAVAR